MHKNDNQVKTSYITPDDKNKPIQFLLLLLILKLKTTN